MPSFFNKSGDFNFQSGDREILCKKSGDLPPNRGTRKLCVIIPCNLRDVTDAVYGCPTYGKRYTGSETENDLFRSCLRIIGVRGCTDLEQVDGVTCDEERWRLSGPRQEVRDCTVRWR